MSNLIISILVAMVDPFVAGVGIGTGLLWNRHRIWAMVLFGVGIAAFVALSIVSRRSGTQFYAMAQTCAVLLWALAFYWTPRAWRAL